MRRCRAGVLLLLLLLLIPLLPAPRAFAAGCRELDRNCVESDAQQESAAVVTKGVQFPGVSPDSLLGQATAANADCSNCQWKVTPACVLGALPGEPGDDAMCSDAASSCGPPAQIRYRVYMRIPPGPWELVDTVCLGPGDRPTSVADVGEAVREVVVNYLPDAEPSFQPAQGGLVNLPTIFAAGEPRSVETETFDVLGFQVVVDATARWEWTFDEGITKTFNEPGGQYPDRSVAYTYRSAGARDVSVTTYWKATFTVDGEGPFAVPGTEISKTAGPFQVPVREAAAQLVGE